MNTENDDRHSIFRDIDVEHNQMRTLLASVHRVLTDRSHSVGEVVTALESLSEFLRAHFLHEDEGGFFEQITEQAPRLSERAQAVQQEHAALLVDLKSMQQFAAEGTTEDAWWKQLDAEFHRLSKKLMDHEHNEQDLLQRSFTDEIGTGD